MEHMISGKDIYLVSFTEQHLHDSKYIGWLRDYDVMKTVYRLEYMKPIPFVEVKKYVETVWADDNCVFLALHRKEDKAFIGTMKIHTFDPRTQQADIGIMVGEKDMWGKGIATDAVLSVSRYCFSQLGLRKLTAGCMSNNHGMRKVFGKLGYKQEGKLRDKLLFEDSYYDHILFGCFEDELVEMK